MNFLGGEGFLAPIGDKGQFKDFCEQNCMSKYEVLHLGKVLEKETVTCSVCKDTRPVEREIIRCDQLVGLTCQHCSDPDHDEELLFYCFPSGVITN